MVKPKKYLGQHFLKDQNTARKIVEHLLADKAEVILEIGPGTGVLSRFLIERKKEFYFIELDQESVDYLKQQMPEFSDRILFHDFLKLDLVSLTKKQVAIIGNFPYNISSQILFKVLENKEQIPEVVGMFQKEVAERVACKPGSKVYGILSVLVQAYYNVEYLFTVNETVFYPPPKVKSGVIRLTRKQNYRLACDERIFSRIVKASFNQRRKVMRNSLKGFMGVESVEPFLLSMRPEQLSFEKFIEIAQQMKMTLV
jgi:16S rRNA (adenine1518-N6/adenine1519-N6)-dimethyltransferase